MRPWEGEGGKGQEPRGWQAAGAGLDAHPAPKVPTAPACLGSQSTGGPKDHVGAHPQPQGAHRGWPTGSQRLGSPGEKEHRKAVRWQVGPMQRGRHFSGQRRATADPFPRSESHLLRAGLLPFSPSHGHTRAAFYKKVDSGTGPQLSHRQDLAAEASPVPTDGPLVARPAAVARAHHPPTGPRVPASMGTPFLQSSNTHVQAEQFPKYLFI